MFGFILLSILVKASIEKYGSEVTEVSVRVDKVKITISEGKGVISRVHIGNPKGFKTDHSFVAGPIVLQIVPESVTKDIILIKEIAVGSPNIIYENSSVGSNFDLIQRNVERNMGHSESQGSGKRMIIDHLSIQNAKVAYGPEFMKGKTNQLSLPDIDLYDIGKKRGGVTSGELTKEIVSAMRAQLTKVIANSVKDTAEAVTETTKETVKNVGKGIKKLFK